ncbi:DUF2935 domain-containing protein [Paenibacillus mucilaginosus]|uniref:DUF2935 domain-containing protein n=1 Tax=Paenibacillus mucilaginosus (strain KNP414) TaxID=1036673 RepID=F8FEP0_PAEMK|nr:DUF2935 domain-containing protein [Paenibacillus mucilaginosus]AEI45357.1 hypothetical protein KNP414_06838 [Paenibacillus mucilaginosus KNP414]MCG7218076.1 DUF2935 domain-containing protein [Paenibacillus mucilaginosus]
MMLNADTAAFWTRNLRDHALFVYDTLSPQEEAERQRALYYLRWFDTRLKEDPSANPRRLLPGAESLRIFLLHLLRRQLTEGLGILLTPTYISHTVSENEEALRVLGSSPGASSTDPQLRSHLLWLPVLAGDAFVIQGALDEVEKELVRSYIGHTQRFEDAYAYAVELAGFLRTGLTDFPAITRFREIVRRETEAFLVSLRELERLEAGNLVLDKLPLVFVEHIRRETEFYMGTLG